MNKYKSMGFSLVELMIAMAIGLVVIASVLAFTMSSLNANTEYVQATRLTQELRNSMDVVSRDLRRTGYDENSMSLLLKTITVPSPFAPIFTADNLNSDGNTATDDCILYAYDRADGVPGTINLARGEIRGLRRATTTINGVTVGVIEMAESASGVTPSCTGTAVNYSTYPARCTGNGWCALSDPRQINITAFNLTVTRTVPADTSNLQIRDIDISIQGTLPGQPDVIRGVQGNIKIRSDCIRTVIAQCNAAPTGT